MRPQPFLFLLIIVLLIPFAPLTFAQESTPAHPPAFEETTCTPEIRRSTVTCGWLVVPEDRSQPDSALIRVYIIIVHSTRAETRADPLLYLTGGPGINMEPGRYLEIAADLQPMLDGRDVIFMMQRGTGLSEPALNCDQMDGIPDRTLTESTTMAAAAAYYTETALQCRDFLAGQGIQLAAYNSAESAADLRDLKQVLGIETWNVYGISYGTRLALTLMRDDPDGIRSAILDSVYMPPQSDFLAELTPNAAQSFHILFEACAADADCNRRYPDLETVFLETVDRLNAEPARVEGYQMDGRAFVGLLYRMMYRPRYIRILPNVIQQAHQGYYADLAYQIALARREPPHYAAGLNRSVYCMDEALLTTTDAVQAAAETVDSRYHGHYHWDADPFALPALCETWTGGSLPDPIENEPVVSAIPTLILAGQFDPASPTVHAQQVAENLSRSYVYVFPGMGHNLLATSACADDIAEDFMADPTTAPDADCLEQMHVEFR